MSRRYVAITPQTTTATAGVHTCIHFSGNILAVVVRERSHNAIASGVLLEVGSSFMADIKLCFGATLLQTCSGWC